MKINTLVEAHAKWQKSSKDLYFSCNEFEEAVKKLLEPHELDIASKRLILNNKIYQDTVLWSQARKEFLLLRICPNDEMLVWGSDLKERTFKNAQEIIRHVHFPTGFQYSFSKKSSIEDFSKVIPVLRRFLRVKKAQNLF